MQTTTTSLTRGEISITTWRLHSISPWGWRRYLFFYKGPLLAHRFQRQTQRQYVQIGSVLPETCQVFRPRTLAAPDLARFVHSKILHYAWLSLEVKRNLHYSYQIGPKNETWLDVAWKKAIKPVWGCNSDCIENTWGEVFNFWHMPNSCGLRRNNSKEIIVVQADENSKTD